MESMESKQIVKWFKENNVTTKVLANSLLSWLVKKNSITIASQEIKGSNKLGAISYRQNHFQMRHLYKHL